VLSAEDVALAIKYGLDGVIVSNHGGRQLDGVPATLDALRECASAAGSKIPIAMDGGIRRGSDIFKAIALGASHVFVGRIPIWGLAVGFPVRPIDQASLTTRPQYSGQKGVELALKILQHEFKLTMGLAGYVMYPLPSIFQADYHQVSVRQRDLEEPCDVLRPPRLVGEVMRYSRYICRC